MKTRFTIVAIIMSTFALCSNSCSERLPPTKEIAGVISNISYTTETASRTSPSSEETIIQFDDGRIKVFSGTSNDTFHIGKRNIITYYEGTYTIRDVKIE